MAVGKREGEEVHKPTMLSKEVRVMNLRKSSQPEDTDTVLGVALMSALVASLMSPLRPDTVSATKKIMTLISSHNNCINIK